MINSRAGRRRDWWDNIPRALVYKGPKLESIYSSINAIKNSRGVLQEIVYCLIFPCVHAGEQYVGT